MDNCLDLDEVHYRSFRDDDLKFVLNALVDGNKNLMNPKKTAAITDKTFLKQARADFVTLRNQAKRPDYAMVAIHNGRRIGFVWATMEQSSLTGDKYAWLRNVYILPELCGQGVAKVLIRMAEEWAAEQGAGDMRREIWSKNKKGKDLYKFLEYKPHIVQVSKRLVSPPR